MSEEVQKKKGARVALTKKQAAEGLGVELVNLSRRWLADGKFEPKECEVLRAWLAKVPSDSLPAIRFLKEEVERCLVVGGVCVWDLVRIQNALIRVIPQKEREEAKAARNEVARVEWEKQEPERKAARQASAECSRALRERYADVWAEVVPKS